MVVNFSDTMSLASKLTFNRLINAFRVYWSFIKSKREGHPRMSGLPISLSLEPTTACNLKCPECPSGLRSFTRPTGKLNEAVFQKVIDELHQTLIYLIFYFQGEPFLHPGFLEMVRQASNKRIYTATSTNAHFLTTQVAEKTVCSGLDRIIISIDGASQATYAAYRKEGKLKTVLEGTKNLIKAKRKYGSSTPVVIWQFLVVRPNEHEIPRVKQMAREYGVDKVVFKTAQIYDYENGNELIPNQNKYSRYKCLQDGTYVPKASMDNNCWKMWHSAVVTWDGQVVPCCFDKDANHQMGKVIGRSFGDIWHGEAYLAFRRQLLTSRSAIEMCKNCSEGAKIWA